jgi:hypothetical protein
VAYELAERDASSSFEPVASDLCSSRVTRRGGNGRRISASYTALRRRPISRCAAILAFLPASRLLD